MKVTTVQLGGLPITLAGAADLWVEDDPYLPFRGNSFSSPGRWLIHSDSPPSRLCCSSRSRPRWEVRRQDNKKIFQLHLGDNNRDWWKLALMDKDCRRGDIWWNRQLEKRKFGPLFCLDIFLWAHLLLARNGLIVHAAALGREGDAYLFPGPTGSGKSTWTELAAADPEWEILGEDKVILRRVGEDYFIYGTPWNPRAASRSATRGVLRGVFFLHPGGVNKFTPLSSAATFQRLLQACLLPFSDQGEMEKVLALLELVSESFPGKVFSFQPARSALPFWRERR